MVLEPAKKRILITYIPPIFVWIFSGKPFRSRCACAKWIRCDGSRLVKGKLFMLSLRLKQSFIRRSRRQIRSLCLLRGAWHFPQSEKGPKINERNLCKQIGQMFHVRVEPGPNLTSKCSFLANMQLAGRLGRNSTDNGRHGRKFRIRFL